MQRLHLQKAKQKWQPLLPQQVARLAPGEAYVAASGGALHEEVRHFLDRPRKILVRSRVSHHGGATRTAVGGEERVG